MNRNPEPQKPEIQLDKFGFDRSHKVSSLQWTPFRTVGKDKFPGDTRGAVWEHVDHAYASTVARLSEVSKQDGEDKAPLCELLEKFSRANAGTGPNSLGKGVKELKELK